MIRSNTWFIKTRKHESYSKKQAEVKKNVFNGKNWMKSVEMKYSSVEIFISGKLLLRRHWTRTQVFQSHNSRIFLYVVSPVRKRECVCFLKFHQQKLLQFNLDFSGRKNKAEHLMKVIEWIFGVVLRLRSIQTTFDFLTSHFWRFYKSGNYCCAELH